MKLRQIFCIVLFMLFPITEIFSRENGEPVALHSISDCRIIVKYKRDEKKMWVCEVISEKRKIPREDIDGIKNQGLKFAKEMSPNVDVFYMLEWFSGISGDMQFLQPNKGKVKVDYLDIVGIYTEVELEKLFKKVME